MGIDDRQYMHRWECDCILCKEAFDREQARKVAKEKKDKEFADNLKRMLNIGEENKIEGFDSQENSKLLQQSISESSKQVCAPYNIPDDIDLKCPNCGEGTIVRVCLRGKNKGKKFNLCMDYRDDGKGCQWKKQIDD